MRQPRDERGPRITLACLDMAGTTIMDDGLVQGAFAQALQTVGHRLDEATLDYVTRTMGQSKVEVFAHLLGSRDAGERGAAAFEVAYARLTHDQGAALIPGTAEALADLRERGMAICLTTGFAPATRDLLIEECGLSDMIDLALSPSDTPSGRGRPAPDMVLTALMATRTSSVSQVMVVGDTSSDMASGTAAGAAMVIGVLTGIHTAEVLWEAGATEVVDSIADLASTLPTPDPR